MTEQTQSSTPPERSMPDPHKRQRVADAVFDVAARMHRREIESRLGELPAGTNLGDVPGPHQGDLNSAHSRAILAGTEGGSYQQRREAEPFVPLQPGEAAPFPGGAQPTRPPVEGPQQ